ncbi:MAG TPA: hypothetical protein VHS53_12335 [Mucilaginibacter sp.]|nr:hypothetical protein [Mucilaginibacter sp.]
MVIDKQRFTDHKRGIVDLQVICEGFIGYKPGLIGCEAVIVGIWCRSRVSAPVSLKIYPEVIESDKQRNRREIIILKK